MFYQILSVLYSVDLYRIPPPHYQLLHPESILEPQNVTVMKKAKITRAIIKDNDLSMFEWQD